MTEAAEVAIPGTHVHVVQLTDTHIFADPAERYLGVDTSETLRAVIDAVASVPPDCVLVTGDLVERPEPGAYQRLLALLKRLSCPVFCLPGNHDEPEMLNAIMNSDRVSTPRLIQAGPWKMVLLNTWEEGSAGGRLPGSELEFLKRSLGEANDTPVLVCLHHPPVSINSPWMDAMGLANPEDFFAVTDSFANVRGIIWGHIHQEFEARRKGVALWGTPSTGVQYSPGAAEYSVDDRSPGFRDLLLLDDGRIETRVARVP